ncbi:MAG: hypothetical protein LUI87_13515, partial [Lachnospiraceae bacterium]|nr:hypothetical protein [Lachnospiraceae bacterium]
MGGKFGGGNSGHIENTGNRNKAVETPSNPGSMDKVPSGDQPVSAQLEQQSAVNKAEQSHNYEQTRQEETNRQLEQQRAQMEQQRATEAGKNAARNQETKESASADPYEQMK